MKMLRLVHLYLGCIFAPMLIFFALTGAAQMFRIPMGLLSEVHTKGYGSLPFMILAVLMGLSVIVTSLLGVAMAFRFGADRKVVWSCLLFGTFLPLVLLVIVHFKQ
jgi:uncharacterized iron-regulated membrane protein